MIFDYFKRRKALVAIKQQRLERIEAISTASIIETRKLRAESLMHTLVIVLLIGAFIFVFTRSLARR